MELQRFQMKRCVKKDMVQVHHWQKAGVSPASSQMGQEVGAYEMTGKES